MPPILPSTTTPSFQAGYLEGAFLGIKEKTRKGIRIAGIHSRCLCTGGCGEVFRTKLWGLAVGFGGWVRTRYIPHANVEEWHREVLATWPGGKRIKATHCGVFLILFYNTNTIHSFISQPSNIHSFSINHPINQPSNHLITYHSCITVHRPIVLSIHATINLSFHSSTHLSTHPSIHPFICLTIFSSMLLYPFIFHFLYSILLSTHQLTYFSSLRIHSSTHPSMHSLIHTPAAYPFIHPTINSSIYPFIHSPTCHPFIQLFIHSLIYHLSILPLIFPLLINSLIHNSSTCFMYVCVYIYTTYFTPSIKTFIYPFIYINKLNNLILFLLQYHNFNLQH